MPNGEGTPPTSKRSSSAFQVRPDPDLHEALRAYSNATGVSMNNVVTQAVTQYLSSTSAQDALSNSRKSDPISEAQEAIRKLSGD